MIFKDIIDQKRKDLVPEFGKLFDLLFEKQSHPGDLLLVRENGFYDPIVYPCNNKKEKQCPYMIGPGYEGHSLMLHTKFIHHYLINTMSNTPFNEYLKDIEWSQKRQTEIEQFKQLEDFSIQLEMLIYLKIWEADAFIKIFYQITRLLSGEPYDWHFKIKKDNKDKNGTGTRGEIIREFIRDRLKNDFPNIYKAFKLSYISQVRNAIAHSQYLILNRFIGLSNYLKNDPYNQRKDLPFNEWIDIIHLTIILYFECNKLLNKVHLKFGEIAKSQKNNLIKVRINRKYPQEVTEYWYLKFHGFAPTSGRWSWLQKDESIKLGIIR